MVKLPAVFREYDKQLHAAFYFLAAAMLNVFFAKRNFLIHLLIAASLFCMGIVIEYAQQYSNRFFANRIHGRFDPEDVKWNVIGLVVFSVVWILVVGIQYFLKSPIEPEKGEVFLVPQATKELKYCPHCGEEL